MTCLDLCTVRPGQTLGCHPDHRVHQCQRSVLVPPCEFRPLPPWKCSRLHWAWGEGSHELKQDGQHGGEQPRSGDDLPSAQPCCVGARRAWPLCWGVQPPRRGRVQGRRLQCESNNSPILQRQSQGRSCLSFKTIQGGSSAKAQAAEEPGRFIAEEILSPALDTESSRNNRGFTT